MREKQRMGEREHENQRENQKAREREKGKEGGLSEGGTEGERGACQQCLSAESTHCLNSVISHRVLVPHSDVSCVCVTMGIMLLDGVGSGRGGWG